MNALDRKAWRELRLMWSQAVTIALVVASGVGGFIGCLSAVDSLAGARDLFYERGQFAQVFASVKRAPDAMTRRLGEIPGVVLVQTTVEAGARVTLEDSPDPVIGHLIGLDLRRAQQLNRVSLRAGRFPERTGCVPARPSRHS
jgi:putative ABC transport system permease protein